MPSASAGSSTRGRRREVSAARWSCSSRTRSAWSRPSAISASASGRSLVVRFAAVRAVDDGVDDGVDDEAPPPCPASPARVSPATTFVTGSRPLNFLATPWGVIAAEITFFTPFVVRPLLASFATLSTDQLDVAASLGASPWRVLRSVIMPEAWPALMAGGSLVLLLTLNEFGIVLFTGAKDVITLPVLIYTRGIVTFDLAGAAVIATVQVALSLALYGIYRLIFTRISGKRKGL